MVYLQKKALRFVIILLLINTGTTAQNPSPATRQKIEIINPANLRIYELAKFLTNEDSVKIKNALGDDALHQITQKITVKDYPICVQNYFKDKTLNPFSNFSINSIIILKNYLTDSTQNGSHLVAYKYYILKVSVDENKTLTNNCKVKRDFYIRAFKNDIKITDLN